MQIILQEKCGSSNILTERQAACWEAAKAQGLAINEARYVNRALEYAAALKFERSVCEAQARHTPVFMLWYVAAPTSREALSVYFQHS